ncbi:MAG TPA: SBBP repeat-containing protein [Candidatus Sulfotelmatobacter sp.]|nr:SBBP repeat-containing protein [Candidatus Sulfotelmatobacter sp.]
MTNATRRIANSPLLLAVSICFGIGGMAAAQTWTRATSFGGPGSDVGISIRVSPEGDQYLTGYFLESVHVGKSTLVSGGDTDIFLARVGQWVVQIGGAGHDEGSDVAFDAAGNVYATGWFTGSATFHSKISSPVTVSGNGETIFLAKYSSCGELDWVQTGRVGSASVNRGHGVAVHTESGAIYVTGVSQNTTYFSSSNGTLSAVPGPRTWHMYLVKYDADGNFQWGEWNQAGVNSVPHKVAVDSRGSAYVTGWFEGQATFHSMDGLDQTVAGLSGPIQTRPDYPDDGFVVKYDGDGNVKWVNDIGGYKAIMNDISVSDSGQVSITGLIGNMDGNAQQRETLITSQPPGTTTNLGGGILSSPYNRDVVVATFDGSGVLLNAVRLGKADNEEGGCVIPSGDDLYVAGMSEKTNNLFIAKLTNGVVDWINENGGPIAAGIEVLPRMALLGQGNIVVLGAFTDTAAFGASQLNSNGAEDVFVAKMAVP